MNCLADIHHVSRLGDAATSLVLQCYRSRQCNTQWPKKFSRSDDSAYEHFDRLVDVDSTILGL